MRTISMFKSQDFVFTGTCVKTGIAWQGGTQVCLKWVINTKVKINNETPALEEYYQCAWIFHFNVECEFLYWRW